MTIHKTRFSGYWHYWLVIVVGIVFVIAYFASDGFGLQP